MKIRKHKDLEVYKLAFETAMEIFELTKSFPKEERYSLTDQIRSSSRSVAANIAEAFRKRRSIPRLLYLNYLIVKVKPLRLRSGLILH